jgi:hypothetical protein
VKASLLFFGDQRTATMLVLRVAGTTMRLGPPSRATTIASASAASFFPSGDHEYSLQSWRVGGTSCRTFVPSMLEATIQERPRGPWTS